MSALRYSVPIFTQHVAGALNQPEEEEVQEGVADHVAHVDHHLVVDEGRGGEANGDHHCSCAQDWRSKQTGGKVMSSEIQYIAPFNDTLDNPGRFPCWPPQSFPVWASDRREVSLRSSLQSWSGSWKPPSSGTWR